MSLIKAVETALGQRGFKVDPTKKRSPSFKPSALGTPCHRKLYYSYNKVPQDFEATLHLQKYGEMGDFAHDRLAANLRTAGVLVDYYNPDGSEQIAFGKPREEFPLRLPDLDIKIAYIDAVTIFGQMLWLGEFKTISKKQFDNLVMPKPEHLVQGALYLYGFNMRLKEGDYSHIKEIASFDRAQGIRFLYECRDNGLMKEFVVTEADKVFKETIAKMVDVKSHTANNTLPAKTPDWCKSCEWRTKCKNDVKVE
jgi:hypothetical protein